MLQVFACLARQCTEAARITSALRALDGGRLIIPLLFARDDERFTIQWVATDAYQIAVTKV